MDKHNVSRDEAMAAVALTSLDRRNKTSTATAGKLAPRKTVNKKKAGVPKTVSIQIIPKKGNYVNHSYTDFSSVPNDPEYKVPEDLEAMTFAQKLHVVLSMTEYQKCISWLPHGRAFRVNLPAAFEKTACPKFFGHKRFASFLRQLNNHGFKHLTSGPSRNGYYHECFLRGLEHIAQYMPRAKDARRQVPDPDNEPDFEAIAEKFPVPEVTPRAPTNDESLNAEQKKIQAILDERKPEATASKTRTYSAMAGPTMQKPQKKPALSATPYQNTLTKADLLSLSFQNQQMMEQLQLQQQLQRMLSGIQQGNSVTEHLLRTLYNSGRR